MLTKKDNTKNEVKSNKNATKSTSSPTSEKNSPDTHTHENHTTSCCQPTHKTTAQQIAKTLTQQQTIKQTFDSQIDKKTSSKTRLTIKFNAGYPNQLSIRGKGANLSWEKGQPLKNTKPDEWVWETDAHFTNCEFKILLNDQVYEKGDNHVLNAGSTLLYTPHFS